MASYGQRRVSEALAWEYSEPHLLAAYQRVFAARGMIGSPIDHPAKHGG
jgi:hypothetical protein